MNYMRGQGTFTYVDPETGEIWEKIEFDGMPYMVSKIDSTHFYMAPEKMIMDRGRYGTPHAYHVAEFKHDPNFYEELIKWLKGREMIGGKSFMESNKNEKKIIEVKEDVVIQQENGTKIILEKGDKVEVLKEAQPPLDVLEGDTVVVVDDKSRGWGYFTIRFASGKVLSITDWDWYSF